MTFLKTFIMAVGLALSAVAANAATWTADGSCALSDISPNADECFGLVPGNLYGANKPLVNTDTFGSEVGLFGYADWSEIQGNENFEGDATGSFTIGDNSYSMVAVLLKSSTQWGAYLIEGGYSGLLQYTTANERGLSNYLVVGRNEVAEIPLPAAGFLLIGGLAGLGLLRRRARS